MKHVYTIIVVGERSPRGPRGSLPARPRSAKVCLLLYKRDKSIYLIFS